MLEIKGIRFEVEINRKINRNMYLRVKDRKVIVNVPYLMPDHEIYRFIEKRKDWIYKVYSYGEYKKRNSYLYRGSDTFYIHARPYKLVRNIGKKSVSITGDTIFLTYQNDSDDAIKYLYRYLDRSLLDKAQALYQRYQGLLSDYGYHLVPEIRARVMTSRWGVCYPKKNRITISSYLIHYPLECLEYIMVHEMTHFIIPNHSKRFYRIVGEYMPEYKKAVEELKL